MRFWLGVFLDGGEEISRRLIGLRSIDRGCICSRELVSRFVIVRAIGKII